MSHTKETSSFMKDIFLSRPNWISPSLQTGLDNFYNLLKSNNLNPRTIGQSDQPNDSPLNEVIDLIKKCEGTVVLGIPQIEISQGKLKDVDISKNIHLATEWNHIEAALAYSLKHPLLIIHHESVARGIFDRGACSSFLHSVDMNDASWPISKQISGALSNWKSKLSKIENHGDLNSVRPTIKWGMYKFNNEDGLFCPVCFETKGLKIPTSRLDTKFYQCPNCKSKFS
jgi:hypothetical protein